MLQMILEQRTFNTDVTDVMEEMGVIDIAGVLDVAGVTDIAGVTGGTVPHVASTYRGGNLQTSTEKLPDFLEKFSLMLGTLIIALLLVRHDFYLSRTGR